MKFLPHDIRVPNECIDQQFDYIHTGIPIGNKLHNLPEICLDSILVDNIRHVVCTGFPCTFPYNNIESSLAMYPYPWAFKLNSLSEILQ